LYSFVLGDDKLLDDSIVDVFRRCGLSHILAISGLHIGIVVSLIYFCFVRLNILTKEKAKLFLCLFLPVYALIAGGQPSVWRASLMVMIRSEEHTSELQSRFDLVCRLLLEKKKHI